MLRTNSIDDLPDGFSEVENNLPEHPFVLLALAVEAGRKLGADSVELEEEFNGHKQRLVVPILVRKK